MVEICTNVRLLPYNTADNFGRCVRNSLPNSCVRTTRNTRNFNPNPNPNPNGKLFESDYTGTQVVRCTVSQQTHICTYLDHDLVGTPTRSLSNMAALTSRETPLLLFPFLITKPRFGVKRNIAEARFGGKSRKTISCVTEASFCLQHDPCERCERLQVIFRNSFNTTIVYIHYLQRQCSILTIVVLTTSAYSLWNADYFENIPV